MNKAPRYLLSDRFDLGMLASLTVDITLTEIPLDQVCHLIEKAEREKRLGLHGGWADAMSERSAVRLTPDGPILLVAWPVETTLGIVIKWVQVELTN